MSSSEAARSKRCSNTLRGSSSTSSGLQGSSGTCGGLQGSCHLFPLKVKCFCPDVPIRTSLPMDGCRSLVPWHILPLELCFSGRAKCCGGLAGLWATRWRLSQELMFEVICTCDVPPLPTPASQDQQHLPRGVYAALTVLVMIIVLVSGVGRTFSHHFPQLQGIC